MKAFKKFKLKLTRNSIDCNFKTRSKRVKIGGKAIEKKKPTEFYFKGNGISKNCPNPNLTVL